MYRILVWDRYCQKKKIQSKLFSFEWFAGGTDFKRLIIQPRSYGGAYNFSAQRLLTPCIQKCGGIIRGEARDHDPREGCPTYRGKFLLPVSMQSPPVIISPAHLLVFALKEGRFFKENPQFCFEFQLKISTIKQNIFKCSFMRFWRAENLAFAIIAATLQFFAALGYCPSLPVEELGPRRGNAGATPENHSVISVLFSQFSKEPRMAMHNMKSEA